MTQWFHRIFKPHPASLLGPLRSSTYLRWQAGVQVFAVVALIQGPLKRSGFDWDWMAPTLLSIPLYLLLYVRMYIAPLRQMPLHAAGLVVLGLVLWPTNVFAYLYLMIAVITLALYPSWRLWLGCAAGVFALSLAVLVLVPLPAGVMATIAMASLFGGFSNIIYMRGVRRDAELRLSQDEVRRLATLAERERIGRDLHDLLGHTLSLVAIKSELARKLALRNAAGAQREMEEVERVARHALTEVRAAVTGMRRSDLAAELLSARLMLEASGIAFTCVVPDALALPHAVEAPLALVLREAVTNIHRHARASEASVEILSEEGALTMRINDNGRGGLAAHGNGVSGMRERVRAIGGTLAIDSPARRGTRLDVRVRVRTEGDDAHVADPPATPAIGSVA